MATTDTTEATRRRLEEIESELTSLRKEYEELRGRWETEKLQIQSLRQLKSEIESVKQQAAEAERDGDYGRVAELRYGTLHDLEGRLRSANETMSKMQQGPALLKEEIGAEDVAEVVAKWTGIPVQRMLETERTKLIKMEERIHERVVGQDDAVTAVSNAIRRSRAGLSDPHKPIGSFIFLGSTGVGKTEMARALAEFLFDDEHSLVRIDMSEYMEKHSVSRLIGAPPGYVGYEEGGQLTELVRTRPYCVVLLDEIEKAHSDVFNILLQVLDDGRLTDGQGRVVDFRNTIIIMTSNLGSMILQDRLSSLTEHNRSQVMSDARVEITNLLRQTLRPEFLNRIDDIILFNPLTRSEVAQIARNHLETLRRRLKGMHIEVEFTDAAVDAVSTRGFDLQFGARPLKRVIQRYIADALAMKVLASEVRGGDKIVIDAGEDGQIHFLAG